MTFVPSAEQRAVIEYGLEPLRVSAGAGTGKTSTLAHRMARLVDRGGILPEQVLGVTFTNKAADELARRIREVRAGASVPGHEVDVFTYHGFAAHLLRAYGVLVGMERDTRIITPPLTRRILRECVTATPFEVVDTTNVRGVIDSLIKLSGELADNLIHPDALLTGTPTDEVEARRAELATALVGFEEAKRRLGVCDYGDLMRLAVDLVRDHPLVADRIRVRYRCVLLDEYQDTNPAQRELFASLFGREVPVTAVGDLDQTIYEWRGASPANFEGFPGRFRRTDGLAARTLRLSFNRRSGQRILDLANRIRTRISVTDPAGDLVALDGTPPGEVHVSWHDDARREAEEIAYETRRLHEGGVAWSDMAVLFRRNRDIEPVRLALEEHDVPLQVADLGGLLQVPEIVEIHAWLRLLADPEDGPALVRILVGSRFRLGLSDLAPLSRWVAEQSRRTDDRSLGHTLVEALEHLDAIGLTGERRESLDGFRQLYHTLLTESQGTNLSDLVRLIMSRTGAWQEIEAMPAPADLTARLNVHRFLDFSEHWNSLGGWSKSPRCPSVDDIIPGQRATGTSTRSFCTTLLEGGSSLEAFLEQLESIRDDPAEGLDTARIGGEDAVTLMTVHRAKGLEWRAVFLPALYRGNFPATPRQLLDPARCDFTLPAHLRIDTEFRTHLDPSADHKERREWLRSRHYDQEWRLAYVASTRAKEYLYLSGAHWYGIPQPHKKPSRPSDLMETARRLDGVMIDRWTAQPPPRPETLRFPALQPGPDPVLGVTWEEALHKILADPDWAAHRAGHLGVRDLYDESVEEFEQTLLDLPEPAESEPAPSRTTVSVTGLVTYADCPKRYFWSEVDRLPRRPGPAARRGTQLHRRIELHNRGMVPFDDLEDDLYDRSTDEGIVGARRPGSNWSAFIGSRYATLTPIHVEIPFELRLSDDTWIRGRVDAVYPHGDRGWEIVDFKSGRRSDRASRDVQLQAYAVAADHESLGSPQPESLRVSFVYLGDGLEVVDQEVDQTWLAEARERILRLVDDIRAGRFEPTPSTACRTCDFRNFCEEGKQFLSAATRDR